MQALEAAEAAAHDGLVAQALEVCGLVCLEAGEAAEAAEYLARSMQQGVEGGRLRVRDGRTLLLRVRAFIQMGDWAAAESQLQAVVEVRRND